MPSSNRYIFALLALCEGNSPVTGELPSLRPVARGFVVFFDVCRNKRLSKQWISRWFQTPPHSLWHNCNVQARRPQIIPEGPILNEVCRQIKQRADQVKSNFLIRQDRHFYSCSLQGGIWTTCAFSISINYKKMETYFLQNDSTRPA